MIYAVDTDNRVKVVNKALLDTLTRRRDQVLGRTLAEISSDENFADIEGQAASTMRTGRPLTDQERAWISADGSVRWFNFTHVPLRDHGTVSGLVCTVQEVTTRRELEQEILEISNREQRRLGSDLHDGLGQELTGLSLLLKGLEVQLSREAPQYTSQITKITDLLAHAIQSTRSLARGLAPVNLERGGLPEALKHLAARCTDMYSLQCTFGNGGPKLPDLEEGAATHLYRIAQEATTNAARYARAKTIAIDLRSTGRKLQLSIADDLDCRRRHRIVGRPRATPLGHGAEDHGVPRPHARRHDQLRRAESRHAHRAVRAAASAADVERQAEKSSLKKAVGCGL
jgi:two-component system, NarL family, sensor histidine kinase UhpB